MGTRPGGLGRRQGPRSGEVCTAYRSRGRHRTGSRRPRSDHAEREGLPHAQPGPACPPHLARGTDLVTLAGGAEDHRLSGALELGGPEVVVRRVAAPTGDAGMGSPARRFHHRGQLCAPMRIKPVDSGFDSHRPGARRSAFAARAPSVGGRPGARLGQTVGEPCDLPCGRLGGGRPDRPYGPARDSKATCRQDRRPARRRAWGDPCRPFGGGKTEGLLPREPGP